MRILVLTQCTDTKLSTPAPAEELYLGDHHARLMRGVRAARAAGDEVDVYAISAKYGLVPGRMILRPYDRTFGRMTAEERRLEYRRLSLAEHIHCVLTHDYEAAVVALGALYAEAFDFDRHQHACPTVRFTPKPSPRRDGLYREVRAAEPETRAFNAGLFSLKGEMAARVLERGVYRDADALLGLADGVAAIAGEVAHVR